MKHLANVICDAKAVKSTYLNGEGNWNTFSEMVYDVCSVVSVKDYGAIGDGTTNDTVAFQNALNAFNEDTTEMVEGVEGGVVIIPNGQYLITDTLRIPNGVSVIGTGYIYGNNNVQTNNKIVFRPTGQKKPCFEPYIKDKNNIEINARNVSIKNIRIDVYGNQSRGIRLKCAKSCVIEDVTIYLKDTDGEKTSQIGILILGDREDDRTLYGCFYNTFKNIRIIGSTTNDYTGTAVQKGIMMSGDRRIYKKNSDGSLNTSKLQYPTAFGNNQEDPANNTNENVSTFRRCSNVAHTDSRLIFEYPQGSDTWYYYNKTNSEGYGQCNANNFYSLHFESLDTAFEIINGYGNGIYGISAEVCKNTLILNGIAWGNQIYNIYCESIGNEQIHMYPESYANYASVGLGSSTLAKNNLEGSKNCIRADNTERVTE